MNTGLIMRRRQVKSGSNWIADMDYTRVPVENIYYLLCYAWNRLQEAERIPVAQCDKEACASLFARVLAGGITQLLKHGLDRGYVLHKEQLSKIRGKIDFAESMNIDYMKMPRLVCEYDEFDYNILHNQILKSTLRLLIRCDSVRDAMKNELRGLYRRFDEIEEIRLEKRHFGMVQLHRNNLFYDFLMKVCELIFDNLTPSENIGKYVFPDFRRNHKAMAGLFEEFVRNFYHREQETYHVSSEVIKWDVCGNESAAANSVLPQMRTDISLLSISRKIIIDTKFYGHTFQSYRGKETVHSGNLYQIFAYLMNTENQPGPANKTCEGILLYPVTQKEHSYEWIIKGHRVALKTINLNQPWLGIHEDLLRIID